MKRRDRLPIPAVETEKDESWGLSVLSEAAQDRSFIGGNPDADNRTKTKRHQEQSREDTTC